MPPKVSGGRGAGRRPAADAGGRTAAAARREYWIQAEPVKWNIVPSGRDAMMDRKVKGKTKFAAYAYRPYSAGLRGAARPGDDPRAADRGGDRRRDRGQLPQPGRRPGDDPPARRLLLAGDGRRLQGPPHRPRRLRPAQAHLPVRLGGARGDRGRLALPRPRADGPAAGVQGPLRPAADPPGRAPRARPASSTSPSTRSARRRPGSTATSPASTAAPTPATRRRLGANVGESVAFNVFALDNDFHTFHVHGHRWTDPSRQGGRQPDARARATRSRRRSSRTTRGAGSTTATSSPTCTRG